MRADAAVRRPGSPARGAAPTAASPSLGFPCNQFGGQEPGTSEEIAEFCSATYGVTFPMYGKIDVNGDDRHEVYQQLTEVADDNGEAGDIQWNFEKFLVAPDGKIVRRFRPQVTPEDAGIARGDRRDPPGLSPVPGLTPH